MAKGKLSPFEPWHIPKPTVVDVAALKAVAAGVASPDQQRHFMAWLILRACGCDEMTFMPGDPHATSFAEGRRRVGTSIKSYLAGDMARFRDPDSPAREQD